MENLRRTTRNVYQGGCSRIYLTVIVICEAQYSNGISLKVSAQTPNRAKLYYESGGRSGHDRSFLPPSADTT